MDARGKFRDHSMSKVVHGKFSQRAVQKKKKKGLTQGVVGTLEFKMEILT